MRDQSSRWNHSQCSLCHEEHVLMHLVVSGRRSNGEWQTIYRLCWDCGYDLLARLRTRPLGKLS